MLRLLTRAAVGTLLTAAIILPSVACGQTTDRYARSVALIRRQQAIDDSIAAPGARSIFLTTGARSPRAVVLFHGLTDSPRQFEALAQLLNDAGDNVYVPRLPQHGIRGGDARRLSALSQTELRQSAAEAMNIASGLGDSVIVAGLSLGGTMASWIAQHETITRSVIIAPAIEAGRIPSLLERPIVGLADHIPNVTRRSASDSTRPDLEPGISTHALAEILELGMSVLNESARTTPGTRDMVILVNANDRTVKQSATEQLCRRWSAHGASVSLYQLPDSLRLPHNIFDPTAAVGGRSIVLQLLTRLIHGEEPTPVVRRLPLAATR